MNIPCNYSFGNTGVGCTPVFREGSRVLFQATKDSTGAENAIDLTQTLNQAYFQAFIDQTDKSKRIYPTPQLWAYDSERAESVKVTSPNKLTARIGQGTRNIKFEIWGDEATPYLSGQLKTFGYSACSVYVIDVDGQMLGSRRTTNKLKPFRIVPSTLDVIYNPADAENPQKIMVSFDISPVEKDEDISVLKVDELVAGTDLTVLEGLIDVYATVTGVSTTGFTIELYTKYGTQLTPVRDSGRVTADFISYVTSSTGKVRNDTDGADVTATVTETATPGIYTVAYAAQTSLDELTAYLSVSGRDYTALLSVVIATP